MTAVITTAAGIARGVRSGEYPAARVLEEYLARIAAHEDRIGAFLLVAQERARAAAEAIDARVAAGEDPGLLAGVPLAVKDALCLAGLPTTAGSKILQGWHPPYTATAVARLEEAGAVVVGKTNLDEFAMGSSNENSAYKVCRNPRGLDRVPGGSSGGSAAAVAAGFASVAIGSDTGGSIRQPASLCGVVGMKPTYGRVSRYGLIAFASSLDQIGPLAGTVEDAALVYQSMAGADPMDATSIPGDLPDVLSGVKEGREAGIAGMRVALVTELCEMEGTDPTVARVFEETVKKLEKSGAVLVEVSVPSLVHALSAYYLIAPAECSSNLARFDGVRFGLREAGDDVEAMNRATREAGFGPEVKRRIMLGTYALSSGYIDAYYGKAQRIRTLVIRDLEAAFTQADVLLSPTSPTVAFPLGARTDDPMSMYISDICTIPANLAGIPALSLPCGTDDAGLPVGLQVMAPVLSESLLFRVACAAETLIGALPPVLL